MFLRNAWYVAAWDHEIGENMLARTIMDESIVFFRTEDGSLAALEDRCCHRHAPLSAGRLIGNEVECGYHGFVFDRTGRCVRVPGQARVPAKAAVRSYPVLERQAHGITPESERTTHHFWTYSRNFSLDDDELNRAIDQIRNTFMEDVQMVEAQQRVIDRFPNALQVDVPSDAPTIQARKLLAGMIEAECSGASACQAVGG